MVHLFFNTRHLPIPIEHSTKIQHSRLYQEKEELEYLEDLTKTATTMANLRRSHTGARPELGNI
jgi:hypothetical protein